MRNSHNLLACLLFTAVFATTASAENVKLRGAYIGAAYGETELDDDGAYFRRFDDQDKSVQVWGGYRILDWLAVEGRYASLGEYDDTLLSGLGEVEADAYTLHAVFIAPFGSSAWDFYGHIGAGVVSYEERAGSVKNDDEGSTVSGGLGIRWAPVPELTLSAGIDVYGWELEGVDDDYDIGVGISRLGVQFNF